MRDQVNLESEGSLLTQARHAIQALADGVCQCATIGTDFVWDTHTDNALQTPLFESLFSDLTQIMGILEHTMRYSVGRVYKALIECVRVLREGIEGNWEG